MGSFVPDGSPATACGFTVVVLEPERCLVLRSDSHLPAALRRRAELDWTWTFVLRPLGEGAGTRFHFRSRWASHPWWLTVAGRLAVVPADFVMGRSMLRGVAVRAEQPDARLRGR